MPPARWRRDLRQSMTPFERLARLPRSRQILLAWLLFYAGVGVSSGLLGFAENSGPGLDLVVGIPTTVLIYLWCKAEAAERGARPSAGLTMFAVVLAPVGMPVYLLRTRRPLRAALKALLKAFGFYLVAVAVLVLSESLAAALRG
jgi:hypothetical protein